MQRQALIALIAVVSSTVHAAPSSVMTPTQQLEAALNDFRAGDFAGAKWKTGDLLHPIRLTRQEEVIGAWILYGASSFELHDARLAEDAFKEALQLDPERDITATTLHFSDGAIKLFDDVKRDLKRKGEQDRQNKQLAERLAKIKAFQDSLRVVETHSYAVNFVPFGAGQFQNHNYRRAYFFAATQGTTFLTSIGIFAYLARTYGFVGKVPLEDGPRVRTLQQVEIVTGAAFFVFYTLGVVDSIRHFKARTNIKTDDSILNDLPDDLKLTPPKKPKATSLRDRLHLGPILTPGGVGLGLSLESD